MSKVTPELREFILRRDRECFVAKLDGDAHQCFDAWGEPHESRDVSKLQIDHVHDGYGMRGKRAPSDVRHMIALCAGVNVPGPSKRVRTAMRRYLKEVNDHGSVELATLRAIVEVQDLQVNEK